MRLCKLLIVLLITSNPLFAQDYILNCDGGRWEGNDLSTSENSLDIERTMNGTSLPNLKFAFTLPAKFGDIVTITEENSETQGIITYFYDHTKWMADESYIILIAQPQQILERWVIQIDSGWTHYTNTKQFGGFGQNLLSTQTFANKCDLTKL